MSQRDVEEIHRLNSQSPRKIHACLHELVFAQARATPHAPAICARDIDLTYAQLDDLSRKLAQVFMSKSIGRGVLVPICFRKCGYAVVTILAILRAGGAIVPIDPAHPKDRILTILQKTSQVVAASPETAGLFESLDVTVVTVSPSLVESVENSETVDFRDRVGPDDPAIVLFTSGSTGVPKGIMQEHASVCSNCAAHGTALGMGTGATSRVFQYAAFTFDVSMMDIFTTLTRGGCVCVPSDEDRLSNLVPTLNDLRTTWAFFTPSVASLLHPEELPHLHTICLGGEAVTQDVLDRWARSGARVQQCYGPAECGVVVAGENQAGDLPANFGSFFGAARCWLVRPDDHDRLVPVGAPGELLVEGPTLARGYLGDPERTTATFIEDPAWAQGVPESASSHRPSRRMYKTGDVLRLHPDGRVTFLGRKDFQLKVRGQRVEVGEVEHHLGTHPRLELSMVLGPKAGPFERALVGVAQPRALPSRSTSAANEIRLLTLEEMRQAQCDPAQIFRFLGSKVPGYMVPTHWLFVEKMPLSASAKIDRKAIAAWITTVNRSQQALEPGNGQADRLLSEDETTAQKVSEETARIVSQGNEPLRSKLSGDNFVLSSMGLDSVQAMSLSMFIRQHFNVRLPIGTIVHPDATIKSVAEAIDRLRAAGSDRSADLACDLAAELRQYDDVLTDILQNGERLPRIIFMTGVTGFLGPHILSLLLERPRIDRIVLHVRAGSQRTAWQRLERLIGTERWWNKADCSRVEVWTGDLAAPKLGLADDAWDRLCGRAPRRMCVTDIVHKGAAVLWHAGFEALRATNVGATVELLRAAAAAHGIARFVYVSGGRHPRPRPDGDDNKEKDSAVAAEVAAANGYVQTKYVAEMLVRRFARRQAASRNDARRMAIVQPGYIIGSPERGMANERDFLWRLAASCIDIGTHSVADGDAWLPVADVERVAGAVVGCLDPGADSAVADEPYVVKVLDGMTVSRFWDVLRSDLGYCLVPMRQADWMALLQQDIKAKGPVHRLWPLLDVLEAGQGCLGASYGDLKARGIGGEEAVAAVKRNMEYLMSVGFVKRPKVGG